MFLTAAIVAVLASAVCAEIELPYTVDIFTDEGIRFAPADSAGAGADADGGVPMTAGTDAGDVTASDNGRVISRTVELPAFTEPVRVVATVTTRPIPKDEVSVHDPWDRAANVRIAPEGMAEIEVVKYITAYGGVTTHEVDVSHLAPLLRGSTTFRGFVDTWLDPAWKMDLTLRFEPWPDEDLYDPHRCGEAPDWTHGLIFEPGFTEEQLRDGPQEIEVEIPAGIARVALNYLVSGHCTDGTDADEFVSKDNVIRVDGVVVYRFKPWRDDCGEFRAVNPYTRRWSDGWWSSDYSRSGWCPGDWVPPVRLDLSDHLTPGTHTVSFDIEDVRPKDEDGHFGYWRVSSHLVGWRE